MSNQKAATEEALGSLHKELAQELAKRIKNGETVTVGEVTKTSPACAATLNVARSFLKDNHVECAPNAPVQHIKDLEEAMEEVGGDDLPDFPVH